jgi:hypothetical protein
MTDNSPIEIEHAVTLHGCTIGRNSRGEWEGMYWPSPPEGDGWVQVRSFDGDDGELRALWRRFRKQEAPHQKI